MLLRCIQENDLGMCAVLFAQVFSSEPWCEPWSEEIAQNRLSHFFHSRGFVGVLAEKDGIAGFALGNTEPFNFGSMFYLREMCIQTNLQKQGVGSKIIEALEKELLSQNVRSFYLTTERSIPAASFYQKHGFKHSEKMGFYTKHVKS